MLELTSTSTLNNYKFFDKRHTEVEIVLLQPKKAMTFEDIYNSRTTSMAAGATTCTNVSISNWTPRITICTTLAF